MSSSDEYIPPNLRHTGPPKRSTREIWTNIAIVSGLFAVLALVTWPMIQRQRMAADRTTATSHQRCIGLALLEFDQEFGSFPNDQTAVDVREATGSTQKMTGNSSNDYFRQLIAYGIRAETIFFCRHPELDGEPDKILSAGRALEPGEVGHSYVLGLNTGMDPGLPVVAAPMIIGTSTFWPEPFDGKASILNLDNSVDQPLIITSGPQAGKIMIHPPGKRLNAGPDTVWGTSHTPDLRHPAK